MCDFTLDLSAKCNLIEQLSSNNKYTVKTVESLIQNNIMTERVHYAEKLFDNRWIEKKNKF